MSTPLNGSNLRKSGNLRNSGYFDLSEAENGGAGAMLQFSLSDLNKNDHKDMVEVTLELDDDSLLVRSILPAIGDESTANNSVAGIFTRSSSASSRICRKFSWLRSSSSRTSSAVEDVAFTPRDARKIQAKLERSRSGAQQALKGLRFINQTTESFDPEKLWRNVESQFENLAKEGLLSRDDFAECIGMVDSKEFATVVFDALVRRKRMNLVRINKDELRDFWLQISNQSFDARLQLFFDMVDSNADGRITREEVKELIMLSASANKLSKLKEQAEEYAALIMEELDPEDLGYIEIWQLETLLLQRDLYMNCSRPLSRNLSWSQNIGCKRRSFFRRIGFKICCFVEENWRRGWILLLWILAMAALFSWKFTQYKNRVAFEVMGYCLSTAKGAAETLKLNMALILLPVCRNTLTWLRSTKARFFVPFDDSINFHKTIASAIVIGIVLHAGNHLTCDFPRIVHSPPIRYELIASYFGVKKPSYRELLSGVEGVTGILMVILMMISFTLATRWFRKKDLKLPSSLHRLTGFNAFWYSHHLLVVVYVLLLIHGNFLYLVRTWWKKNTWMYISVPLLIYVGERILRAFRSTAYSVKINQVSILPGGVMSLIMSKPHGFRYRSGQYIFLQCPLISSFEWHPFSITSAPGDENLSVHIRTLGDWTRELRRVFTESCTPSSLQKYGKSNDLENGKEKCLPKLLVDGPYGAAAQDYRNYDVLLLVGLGIGATPFISILRDLLNERKMAEEQTDSSIEINKSGHKKSHRTTSAHFYWVTRDPGSFEWFKGVMNQVAEMDQKGMIELHNYLTSVYEEGDARSTLLTMVQALNHAKHGVDIVSGTRVRTHFARPNWKDVFAKVNTKYPFATVGVFYCGMPMLGKELKKLSQELSHTTSTRFEFHKEYF